MHLEPLPAVGRELHHTVTEDIIGFSHMGHDLLHGFDPGIIRANRTDAHVLCTGILLEYLEQMRGRLELMGQDVYRLVYEPRDNA